MANAEIMCGGAIDVWSVDVSAYKQGLIKARRKMDSFCRRVNGRKISARSLSADEMTRTVKRGGK